MMKTRKHCVALSPSLLALWLVLPACDDDDNQWPTVRIDNPSQDTAITWPYGSVDFQGTATDVDGFVVTHDWAFDFGHGASVEDPGVYTYDSWGVDTVRYQVWDDEGAKSEVAEVVVTVLQQPVDPVPGDWSGLADFGTFAFTVNDEADAVTSVSFGFDSWGCGTVTFNDSITATYPSGWPITDGGFAIDSTLNMIDFTMALQGSFGAILDASGSWTATSGVAECSGTWAASSDDVIPEIAVMVHADFRFRDIVGLHWLPGSQVTLEIDNGADGSIEYTQATVAANNGDVRFHEGHQPPPYTAAEGDLVTMHGGDVSASYSVRWLTLASVDADTDVLSGGARDGTLVRVWAYDPSLPFPQAHELEVLVGASGSWTVDFSGVFDILPTSRGGVSAACTLNQGVLVCGNSTGIEWP